MSRVDLLGATQVPHVVAARGQMAATLGFHIIIACFGIAFPAITMAVHWVGLRRNDPAALLLARRWAKVMAVLFSVGAVTGTVLSFEMGLLWPGLMRTFGPAIGIPFSVEGIFFLLEGVFTAIYLFGWTRLRPWVHFWTGLPAVLAGALGALAVVAANSWMNQPGGFTISHGHLGHVHPLAVFFNRATTYEAPHMILAAYMVVGFSVASVYAVGMLRGRRDRYHRLGFLVPFSVAALATPVQIFVGDTAARAIAHQQPVKFAAMEYVLHTHRHVTEWIFGVLVHGKVYLGVGLPDIDSILVGWSPGQKVIGLDSVPPADRPPLPSLIHLSFDTMVTIGFALLALGAWLAWSWFRRRDLPRSSWFLWASSAAGVGAVVAMECGWITTEVGRQPWIVYHVMRVAQAATTSPVTVTLWVVVGVYVALGASTVAVLLGLRRRWRGRTEVAAEGEVPYEPRPASRPVLR